MKRYADEPLMYLVGLFAVQPQITSCQGSVLSYLWSTLGIDSQSVEIDINSLNIWSMLYVPAMGIPSSCRDPGWDSLDPVSSAWNMVSSSSLTQSRDLYCSTCIKLVEGMIKDPEYSRYVAFIFVAACRH